jgi:uncharacterized protein YozE (UPF0346 family)
MQRANVTGTDLTFPTHAKNDHNIGDYSDVKSQLKDAFIIVLSIFDS